MIVRSVLACTAAAVVSTLAATGVAAQNIIIKTGPQGGVWYPVSAGLAGVLQDKAKMNVTVQTGGGVSNAVTVARNEGQIGFTTSGVAKEIYEGAGGKPPEKDLRLFGVLYNQYYTFAVYGASPVKSIKDLKGRAITVNEARPRTEGGPRRGGSGGGMGGGGGRGGGGDRW